MDNLFNIFNIDPSVIKWEGYRSEIYYRRTLALDIFLPFLIIIIPIPIIIVIIQVLGLEYSIDICKFLFISIVVLCIESLSVLYGIFARRRRYEKYIIDEDFIYEIHGNRSTSTYRTDSSLFNSRKISLLSFKQFCIKNNLYERLLKINTRSIHIWPKYSQSIFVDNITRETIIFNHISEYKEVKHKLKLILALNRLVELNILNIKPNKIIEWTPIIKKKVAFYNTIIGNINIYLIFGIFYCIFKIIILAIYLLIEEIQITITYFNIFNLDFYIDPFYSFHIFIIIIITHFIFSLISNVKKTRDDIFINNHGIYICYKNGINKLILPLDELDYIFIRIPCIDTVFKRTTYNINFYSKLKVKPILTIKHVINPFELRNQIIDILYLKLLENIKRS
ncbi:MAG: hypothetical protein ACTSRP_09885 [Candidatus Helarchaeota archaeon]